MIRAFLALALPDTIRSALTVQQFLIRPPGPVPPENFHLTLVFMGETPEPVLEELHHGLEALRIAPFILRLQGLGLFGGAKPHSLWAGLAPSAPLMQLQQKVERLARGAGCRVEARSFRPHVTLARFARLSPEERVHLERAVGESPFQSAEWQVEGMRLVRSTLGKRGSHYDDLAEYAFG